MHATNKELLPRSFEGGLLRRLSVKDLASFQSYRSIPELGRYQGWSPLSEVEALDFLTRMNAAPLFSLGNWIQLGIAERVTERLVGDIGIFLTADGQSAHIGFTLELGSQGRGMATAAVRAAIQLLFAATTIHQVLGFTDERNHASCRLLERVGFYHKENRDVIFRDESCTERAYVLQRKPGDTAATGDTKSRGVG